MPSLWPVGFAPGEISSLVNREVVRRHADEAAFLWTQRARAVGEAHYALKDLARLDERVEAHVSGLRASPDVAWASCAKNLEIGGHGEIFAASVLAFGMGDRGHMREALLAGTATVSATRGLISALGWLDYPTVQPWIVRLIEAREPLYRLVGLTAFAIHRVDAEDAVKLAVDDPESVLRARSLRTIGEMKRRDLLDEARDHLSDRDDDCRFWAAWALALNGDAAGTANLTTWYSSETAHTWRAMQLGLRAMDAGKSREWVSSLSRDSVRTRAAVVAAGIVGDPAAVPWLIRRMESPDTARLAGEAFSMITGVDLAYQDLDQDAPGSPDHDDRKLEDVIDPDYESNLRYPAPALVERWWDENGGRFSPGVRHLSGRPIAEAHVVSVLLTGKQRQRAAAALELALLRPAQAVFEVRARGDRQQRAVNAWSS